MHGVSHINQTHVQVKEAIINKLTKLDKVFTSKRRIIIYKMQTKFIRSESVTSNTNSLHVSRERTNDPTFL